MKDRFKLVSGYEALVNNLPGTGRWTNDMETLLYDFKTNPPILIASDSMEPEDVSFYRDLAWVPKLLNQLEEEKDD